MTAVPDPAAVRVVGGGEPTPAELAALVVAVTAVQAAAQRRDTQAGRRRGGWADRSSGLRRPLRAGAGAWRHHPNTH